VRVGVVGSSKRVEGSTETSIRFRVGSDQTDGMDEVVLEGSEVGSRLRDDVCQGERASVRVGIGLVGLIAQ